LSELTPCSHKTHTAPTDAYRFAVPFIFAEIASATGQSTRQQLSTVSWPGCHSLAALELSSSFPTDMSRKGTFAPL
jgi:hypothetical protein